MRTFLEHDLFLLHKTPKVVEETIKFAVSMLRIPMIVDLAGYAEGHKLQVYGEWGSALIFAFHFSYFLIS